MNDIKIEVQVFYSDVLDFNINHLSKFVYDVDPVEGILDPFDMNDIDSIKEFFS